MHGPGLHTDLLEADFGLPPLYSGPMKTEPLWSVPTSPTPARERSLSITTTSASTDHESGSSSLYERRLLPSPALLFVMEALEPCIFLEIMVGASGFEPLSCSRFLSKVFSLNSVQSLLPVAPPVHRLNVVRMVVLPGSAMPRGLI